MDGTGSEFPAAFDHEFLTRGGQRGYFGRNVLKRLVDGLEIFLEEKQSNPGFRSIGPAALCGFLWLDDPELVDCLARFDSVCVVVDKQGRSARDLTKLSKLKLLAESDNGMLASAFAELTGLSWREDGRAQVVGPWTPMSDLMIPPVRSIGFRRRGGPLVPILHTKIALLGEMWWDDEDGAGAVADVAGFRPERLWVGSANGTASSRKSLEFGMWLDDPQALRAAEAFLVQLMAHSEALDPDSDVFEPELIPVDFDDEEFARYVADNMAERGDLDT